MLSIFNKKHNNNPTEFYFDVLHHLLNGKLHHLGCHHCLYLSQRGNNTLKRFEEAVNKALEAGKAKYNKFGTYNDLCELLFILMPTLLKSACKRYMDDRTNFD